MSTTSRQSNINQRFRVLNSHYTLSNKYTHDIPNVRYNVHSTNYTYYLRLRSLRSIIICHY